MSTWLCFRRLADVFACQGACQHRPWEDKGWGIRGPPVCGTVGTGDETQQGQGSGAAATYLVWVQRGHWWPFKIAECLSESEAAVDFETVFSIKALGLKEIWAVAAGHVTGQQELDWNLTVPPNCQDSMNTSFRQSNQVQFGRWERPFWNFGFAAVILQEHQWISAFDFGTTGMMVRSCIISSAEFFIVFRILYQQMHQSQPLRAPQHDEDSNIQELIERLRILEESVMSSHQEAESPGSSQCFQKWWLAVQNKLLRRVLLVGVLEPELLKLSLDLSYFCRSSNVNDLISLDFSLFRFSGLFWYLQGKRLQPALLLCSEGEVSNHDEMTWNVLTCVLWIVNFCMWFSA